MPTGTTHYAFWSPSNWADMGYSVYLPPDYSQGSKRYPVMYMLHGAGGNEIRGLWLASIVQKAISVDTSNEYTFVRLDVKQRGKMTRESGKAASKTVHPGVCHDPVFCRRNLGCYLWILLPKLDG
ncbi:MAG: alpha/beta hydrolase-fold protein, partial [Methylococcaceae bacterium]